MKMLGDLPDFGEDFGNLRRVRLADESLFVRAILPETDLTDDQEMRVEALALQLLESARAAPHAVFEDFLQTWRLDTREGRVLLTLAEALLRIPDDRTRDELIHDLLPQTRWQSSDASPPLTAWAARAFGMAGDWLRTDESPGSVWQSLRVRIGDRMVRPALMAGIHWMAGQFVLGETPGDALDRRQSGLRYSIDCLGEAAQTQAEAEAYHLRYLEALDMLARREDRSVSMPARDSLSIKLSALHPRYDAQHWADLQSTLLPRLTALAARAADAGIPLTFDAEESDHLELSLALFAKVRRLPALASYEGLGLAVQAYQKRAGAVIDWLAVLAKETGCRIPVRLVKGAYWDSEIRQAQMLGLDDYPVFTRKRHTDAHYLGCARRLLGRPDCFLPQFATHNARTLAWLHVVAGDLGQEFEVQRLAGMGEPVHRTFQTTAGHPLRLYAPVGRFAALLPYLVRRLLENGSAQSFVNQLANPQIPAPDLARDPLRSLRKGDTSPHPRLPRPPELFFGRENSRGFALSDLGLLSGLRDRMTALDRQLWVAGRPPDDADDDRVAEPRHSPADRQRLIGTAHPGGPQDVLHAYRTAAHGFAGWSSTPVATRANAARAMAGNLESHRTELLCLLMLEGGKTLADARDEWREAVDLCRYYAVQAERLMQALDLPAVTGERNRLYWAPRGVFLCLSPWNFPLAILLGQVMAALVTGNSVIMKPAHQTQLIAQRIHDLLLASGFPADAVQAVFGRPADLGPELLRHPVLAGVAFTGSCATARQIARELAAREGPLVPLIAETGGLNAMIADSSALPEQLVRDVMTSAFNSAGQRCSALRVLWLQDDLVRDFLPRLEGAMACWKTGHPGLLATDAGPMIDAQARSRVEDWITRTAPLARWSCRSPSPDRPTGYELPPAAFLLDPADLPREEIFGPVLHIATWQAGELSKVLDRVQASGYGLTLGLHSRIGNHLHQVDGAARVGNLYLNRNQIGAVVECQPFGGEGLSGTGFKAGGPHYLMRFCTERTVSENLAALGLNPQLLDFED